jgi:hypothetical protein
VARVTKKTLRRNVKAHPLAVDLMKVANELQRLNLRVMKLSRQVSDKEADSAALQRFMATLKED